MAFEPYTLRIQDPVSGQEYEFPMASYYETVQLKNVQVSGASTLQLAISIRPFSDRLHYFIEEIRLE